MIAETLIDLIQAVKKQKAAAEDGETARRLAIVIAELEKVYAFVVTYL